ncbi:MAG: 30S ribosomal protein S5 [Candidatus Sungbacteria bacterium RIFCSPHIGHO2_02_FULL_47_11]|uniref:Small ribosomal subunit protein uS5 n=1 Tax=Candidatus Sungbacteria bacterium RIFCSPHIGHO2_02_FULL_47_11 TaxID=1802270 RepID=A0A1G2KP06_9BACT|nr:MAG: 30S ribosomal protein S5 [Candidatus Sungbacteria bacterium RIFCSPHIGHO2_02_FULL_47_11]
MARPRERRSEYRAEKSEFDQRVLEVRRTARVIAGGRRFSFRAAVVVGNRNGKVGVGVGKGGDVATAVNKATRQAKKQIVVVPFNEHKTIPYVVEAKFSAARVLLKPAREGNGLVAGGPVRVVADLAGIQNLTAKILGSTTNKLNNARATVEALKKLK